MVEFRSGIPTDAAFSSLDFFEGWPTRPDNERFMVALRGSYAVEVAISGDAVVGFVNAISDGVAAGFIPWLEVVPAHRNQRIGQELMARMRKRLSHLYSIDLVCDSALVPYYQKIGMSEIAGMGLRAPGNLGERSENL
jgi:ribosomal protein S18 acetylase RimI-like enzyme